MRQEHGQPRRCREVPEKKKLMRGFHYYFVGYQLVHIFFEMINLLIYSKLYIYLFIYPFK